MKNTDNIEVTWSRDPLVTVKIPAWCILDGIDKLSDEDKADLATNIVGMISDTMEGRDFALSVLQQRCKHCGKWLGFDGVCYCWNDE